MLVSEYGGRIRRSGWVIPIIVIWATLAVSSLYAELKCTPPRVVFDRPERSQQLDVPLADVEQDRSGVMECAAQIFSVRGVDGGLATN